MKPKYYVDIPTYDEERDVAGWRNIAEFDSREEAEKFLFDKFNIRKEHCKPFIAS